jgi:hypothetical protein
MSTRWRASSVLTVMKKYGVHGCMRSDLVKEVMKINGCTYAQANAALHSATASNPRELVYQQPNVLCYYAPTSKQEATDGT